MHPSLKLLTVKHRGSEASHVAAFRSVTAVRHGKCNISGRSVPQLDGTVERRTWKLIPVCKKQSSIPKPFQGMSSTGADVSITSAGRAPPKRLPQQAGQAEDWKLV